MSCNRCIETAQSAWTTAEGEHPQIAAVHRKAEFEAKYGAVLGAIIGAVAMYLIIVMTRCVDDAGMAIAMLIAASAFEAAFVGFASYILIKRRGIAKMRLRLVEFLHHSHVGGS